jgi:hypothetical protein
MSVLSRLTFLTIFILFVLSQQVMANVSAQVDRKTAYEGESITLSVRAENLAGMNKPDFSPLTKDFELSGTSQSSSISIINGRSTASQKWSVRLHPLKTGKIQIPALQVGQLETLPIDIEIKPIPVQTGAPTKGQPLFITLDVDSEAEHFYVQQHIPLVVKLYYKHEIRQGRINDPQPDSASLEKLGDDTSYESQYNGQNYKVFERRYSLLVEKSGQLTIPAASFQGYMQKPQSYGAQQGYDPFSSFMLRSPVMNQGQPVSVRSEPLKLEIESHPPEFDGNQWLPAENLQLEDSWTSNPPTFRVGEPVSRTITIMAKGLVASQIKPLELPKVSSFRRYAEPAETETRTDGQTVYGVSRRTFTYIPAYAGEQRIPELDIKWWNVVTGKQEVTSLPAWEIRVEANPAAQQGTLAGKPDSAVADITDATQQATPSKDQNDKSGAISGSNKADFLTDIKALFDEYRYWLGAFVLLVIVLYFMRPNKRRKIPPTTLQAQPAAKEPTTDTASKKQLLDRLHQACDGNDINETAKALLDLARLTWPDTPPMSIGALANNVSEGKAALLDMDRCLYSGQTDNWNGEQICNLFGKGFGYNKTTDAQKPVLKPLYPQ